MVPYSTGKRSLSVPHNIFISEHPTAWHSSERGPGVFSEVKRSKTDSSINSIVSDSIFYSDTTHLLTILGRIH